MGWVDGIADPALNLHSQYDCVQQLQAADLLHLGNCQNSGRNRSAWVDNRPQVGVIEIEYMGADAVDECSIEDVQSIRTAQNGGGRTTGGLLDGGQGYLHCRMADCAYGHAQPVHEGALCFMKHGIRQRFRSEERRVGKEGRSRWWASH